MSSPSVVSFNPPTKGHALLISRIREIARINDAEHIVFLSQTKKYGSDPLDWNFKRQIFESAFPEVNVSDNSSIINPFQALKFLKEEYNRVILVVGDDQVKNLGERMLPYAKEWGIDFEIISAGLRNEKEDGIKGISATKMRKYVLENNWKDFEEGLPENLDISFKKAIFDKVRTGLFKESKDCCTATDK